VAERPLNAAFGFAAANATEIEANKNMAAIKKNRPGRVIMKKLPRGVIAIASGLPSTISFGDQGLISCSDKMR